MIASENQTAASTPRETKPETTGKMDKKATTETTWGFEQWAIRFFGSPTWRAMLPGAGRGVNARIRAPGSLLTPLAERFYRLPQRLDTVSGFGADSQHLR